MSSLIEFYFAQILPVLLPWQLEQLPMLTEDDMYLVPLELVTAGYNPEPKLISSVE